MSLTVPTPSVQAPTYGAKRPMHRFLGYRRPVVTDGAPGAKTQPLKSCSTLMMRCMSRGHRRVFDTFYAPKAPSQNAAASRKGENAAIMSPVHSQFQLINACPWSTRAPLVLPSLRPHSEITTGDSISGYSGPAISPYCIVTAASINRWELFAFRVKLRRSQEAGHRRT